VVPSLRFIADSSPCVPLLGVSTTPLENASPQASYLKEWRVNIVVRLLAQGLVVVLLMAFGWWAMTTLGSDSLQATRYPQYVAGCPLADTLGKRSAGGGCSKEGASHPICSRRPGGSPLKHAHGGERHSEGKAPPRSSENPLPRTPVNSLSWDLRVRLPVSFTRADIHAGLTHVVLTSMRRTGAKGPQSVLPSDPCRMPDTDFREFPFHALG
jgi:hypothetical protein